VAAESQTTSSPRKVHAAVPENYWDLPEDERLVEAAKIGDAIRAGLAEQKA
jgi:hypothetical protein